MRGPQVNGRQTLNLPRPMHHATHHIITARENCHTQKLQLTPATDNDPHPHTKTKIKSNDDWKVLTIPPAYRCQSLIWIGADTIDAPLTLKACYHRGRGAA